MTDDDPGDAQPADETPALTATRPWTRTAHPYGDNPCQIDVVEFSIEDPNPVAAMTAAMRALKRRMEAAIVGDQKPRHGSITESRQTASASALGLRPDQCSVAFFRPITMHQLPSAIDPSRCVMLAEWRLVPRA